MDIKQINSAIMFGTWTDTELGSMIDAIKFARTSLQKQNIRAITLNSNVEFTSTKMGRTMRGFVHKIGHKYVTVNTGAGLWRVPANMLRIVE
jgi:hypothetical protein